MMKIKKLRLKMLVKNSMEKQQKIELLEQNR